MNVEAYSDWEISCSNDQRAAVTEDIYRVNSSGLSYNNVSKSVLETEDRVETPSEETREQEQYEDGDDFIARTEEINITTTSLPVIKKKAQPTRQRSRLSYGRKKEICLYKLQHPTASLNYITKYFTKKWSTHVSRTTVCHTLVHSQKWLSVPEDCHDMLRIMPPKCVELDSALYSWYVEAQKKYGSLTNDILITKAKELGKKLNITDLSYSNGWLYGFKKRHGILNASTQSPSTNSLSHWQSTFNSRSRTIPAEDRCNINSTSTSLNLPKVPQNVTFTDACQGLLKVISYLEAHHAVGGEYIPLLWQIFQQICNQMQDDLYKVKYGHSSIGDNGFQMSSDTRKEGADELDMAEEELGENIDDLSQIKTEQLDPGYEKNGSSAQVSQANIRYPQTEQSDRSCIRSPHESDMLTLGSTERSHPCSECGQQFGMLTELLKHMTSHAVKTPLVLETKCRQIEDLQQPVKIFMEYLLDRLRNENVPDVTSSRLGISRVSDMEQEVTSDKDEISELRRLKSMHQKTYTCEICGRKFNNYSNFRRHVRLHSGRKPFKCTVCGKSFANGTALRKHGSVHTGERPHICTICGKGLSQATGLILHMRVHTGERPYQCNICGKDFAQPTTLKKHMRIHTGEKPYQCPICGKHFLRSGDLAAHIRMHTGEKPFKCNICGKCFTQRGNLSKHSRTHLRDGAEMQNFC
ncbi:hypothetical protein LSH36_88g06005 [Paralvinella palmiformis]|uniref:Uncharacterized protein n=1 Tax=Paralvinella palmiformis TaxID=53620 RepID=A0AAD9NCB3_9ANNE|nr:hypothetical protein LSH36_88g06005 [Paralvinella palmiformis]